MRNWLARYNPNLTRTILEVLKVGTTNLEDKGCWKIPLLNLGQNSEEFGNLGWNWRWFLQVINTRGYVLSLEGLGGVCVGMYYEKRKEIRMVELGCHMNLLFGLGLLGPNPILGSFDYETKNFQIESLKMNLNEEN